MIKILIDSGSDIDSAEAASKSIYMLPMEVRFGEKTYLDGVTLSHRRFFELLVESDELPKTSQINSYRWSQEFEKLTADGSAVIAITISSKLSGTYGCAKSAAKNFNNKVRVIDSKSAAIGERLLCDFALRLLSEGKSVDDIVSALERDKNRIQVIAVVDTLKYLRKGGRISGVAAIAGEMLSIKPVISVSGGEVKLVGKAIGSKKSNNLLMQHIEKCGGIDFSMPYGLAYSGLSDEYLQKYIKDSRDLWSKHINSADELPRYLIGSAIGTHIGPNAVGVAFFSTQTN